MPWLFGVTSVVGVWRGGGRCGLSGAAVQMVDVKIPTTEGREPVLIGYTQSKPELQLLLELLRLTLAAQPSPKFSLLPPPFGSEDLAGYALSTSINSRQRSLESAKFA
jgi:hypothetical protein